MEAFSLLSRGSGLAATVLFLAGLLGGPWVAPLDAAARLGCLVGIVLMTAACALAAVNLRRPGGRHYTLLSAVQVGFDTIAISGMVTALQASTGQTTWPLVIVSVVIAALRLGLPGALTAWAATSVWLGTAAHVFGDRVMPPADLITVVMVNFMVAVLSGTQASAFGRQVKELERARRQLHHQASHDVLTGLPNRQRLLAYGTELGDREMAVLLLDLNGFKQVNDARGHAAGDELLCEVSRRLAANLRDGDLAGRLGGDEFLVVLADTDLATAACVAGRLRAEIQRPVDLPGGPVTVGVSIGTAGRAAGDDTDLPALTLAADAAMYSEKALSKPSR